MSRNINEIIAKKRDGAALFEEEIHLFVDQLTRNKIPDYQTAAFLMAIYINGLNREETCFLTQAMVRSGKEISLEGIRGVSIDKHSTGGVGDKVSFVVAPLVAACGVNAPMISGRGLGHTGGTLDKLESIPNLNVNLLEEELIKVIRNQGMAICSQTEELVPADRILYALRNATETVSSIPLVAASIMSKKLALKTQGVALDVKYGKGAFFEDPKDGERLLKTMVMIGDQAGRPTSGLITAMDQPLGNAVGNALEIKEAVQALGGQGPEDLMEVACALGTSMLRLAGQDSPETRLKDALESGQGLRVFTDWVKGQNGDLDLNRLPSSQLKIPYKAESNGYVKEINAFEVGQGTLDLGAGRRRKEDGIDLSTGFYFHKKVGDLVTKGETLVEIHANKEEDVERVTARLDRAIKITKNKPEKSGLILKIVDKNGARDYWASINS